MATNKVKCPECGKDIDLVPKEDDPLHLIAFHDCRDGIRRPVVETDSEAGQRVARVIATKPDQKE